MFRTFRKVLIALVVLLVLVGLAPNAYAEEIQPEPIAPELATGEPPVPTATPQKGGGDNLVINGPATVDSTTPVTFTGPISPIRAEMSVHVACDRSYAANLYIPRGDNHEFMGLWYPDTAMRFIGGDTTVVDFDGSSWPASVSLTDSQGRTVNITITEYNDCTEAPAAAVSSVTTGTTSVGPTLPATGAGDKTRQIVFAASCVLAGIMLLRVRRQNV